jgi:hypothetical protein
VIASLAAMPIRAAEEAAEVAVSGPFPFVRISCDANGGSHFSEETILFKLVDFAPPAPPISISAVMPAESVAIISSPAGWHGDFHPAPRRQFMFMLSGELEVEVSDGEIRRLSSGSVLLVEDTTCRGHISRVVGKNRVYMAAMPLRDQQDSPQQQ